MKKRNVIILLAALFLLINFISLASAKEDFNIKAPSKISLCPCSGQSYNIEIKNTGGEESTYLVSPSASNQYDWVSTYPQQFTLKPNQKTSVPVSVTSACGVTGGANFGITIKTRKGMEKTITQNYVFNSCYNHSISRGNIADEIEEYRVGQFTSYRGDYAVCGGEQSFIPILIKNEDNIAPNTYNVEIEGESWASIPLSQFWLDKGNSGLLFLELFPPKDAEGSFDFTLKTSTALGEIEREDDFIVDIRKCHLVELNIIEEKDRLCAGDLREYNVDISNIGENEEFLLLESAGAGWADVDNSVALSQSEKATAVLKVNPESNASGEYPITVSAVSSFVNKSDEITLSIDSKEECYKTDISQYSFTNKYSTQHYSVRIKNDGIRDVVYKVSVEGPKWLSVEPSSLSLRKGESYNVDIKAEPTDAIPSGAYPAILKLNSGGIEFTKEITINLMGKDFIDYSFEFLSYFRYYFYLLIVLIIITFINVAIFRWKVIAKLRERSRQRQIKKKRIENLKKAREARRFKKRKKD